MRKLKLQVQITINGFIAGPNGEMDMFTWNWGEDIKNYVQALTDDVDTIVLGRKLAEGFIPYWQDVAQNDENPEQSSGKLFTDLPKIVFSKTIENSPWNNTTVSANLINDIQSLKSQNGKDIIAYGGANFVSNLIQENLIDELHLFINPTALDAGLPIFLNKTNFQLKHSLAFECGIVVLCYEIKS
ncbi:MAG TPA: dihydrofolate reductase family protein [Saprospiraceae bacterium]|nr:dihydrofolate reductase family protein [Saprospiraceae bacterium]